MPQPLRGLENIEEDINQTVEKWQLLKDYSSEVTVLSEKSWIDFRGSVFDLQDLGAAWAERSKSVSSQGCMGSLLNTFQIR